MLNHVYISNQLSFLINFLSVMYVRTTSKFHKGHQKYNPRVVKNYEKLSSELFIGPPEFTEFLKSF